MLTVRCDNMKDLDLWVWGEALECVLSLSALTLPQQDCLVSNGLYYP